MPGKAVSYGDCDPKVLCNAVTAITSCGDAVTLGLTSEGGAYYVGVLCDGQLERFYLDSRDDLQECLRRLEAVALTP